MNSDINIISRYDGNSWHRVGMLARYYAPSYRNLLVVYSALSALLAILSLTLPYSWAHSVWSMGSSIMSYCALFGPIVFLRRRDNEVFTALPAHVHEKFVFFLISIFIVIPLSAQLLPWLAGLRFGSLDFVAEANNALADAGIGQIFTTEYGYFGLALTLLTTWTGVITVLWAGFTARRNRIGKGILMYFVLNISLSILVGIYGVIVGIGEAVALNIAGSTDLTVKEEFISSIINQTFILMFAVLLAYLGFALVMFYRTLANRQC